MRVILATNNKNKVREMQEILSPLGMNVISQKDANFNIEVDETGETFAENAYLKAKAVYDAVHCPVIADDSGLIVDAINGEPGVHSHRFAGENSTDEEKNSRILELLKDVSDEKRTARFQCVICYINSSGKEEFFTGVCEGKITDSPRGENGFGYDPIFLCEEKTMAEMTTEEKNQISHRANALKQFRDYLKKGDF